VATTSTPATGAGEPTADERELLGWSNKQFALQLLGAGSSATVTKFMQQGGGVKLYAYRTDLNGRPWFIVVTGPYPSRNAATAAADTLPAALRNQKPWPRAVKNIHADIRQRK
jgi:DamX protein